MRTVRQLLADKSPEVHAIAPDAPVLEALRRMAAHGIGALLVMDGPRLVGLVSERDYARKVVLLGRASQDTPVREIMTGELATVAPGDTVEHCMQLVTDRRIRHLPVLEQGQVVGVLSIGDLVKAVIEEQQQQLEQLQRYIAS
ncbi:CBS domain-containing protein [Thermomonas flagellata]|uniref:CBS domain-containing protein n=1 Tax=Thermomonas flagellata TaxID=2888524 RepID=UPI001F041190|nr:CBS domain-containing protein [Thermomonas flagellata]